MHATDPGLRQSVDSRVRGLCAHRLARAAGRLGRRLGGGLRPEGVPSPAAPVGAVLARGASQDGLPEGKGLRWWGWGTLDRTYPLGDRPGFWPFLDARIGPLDDQLRPVTPLSEIGLPPPRLPPEVLSALRQAVGPDHVSTEHLDRVTHALGKSYPDLIRLRRGEIEHPPDAVISPGSEGEVAAVLRIAGQARVAVVPFGGGTSVVGGLEPVTGPDHVGAISLDLRRLNRLVSVDPASRLAVAEPGMRGPELEAALNTHGFTLGHFPQSWEFSTLGGWIATRAAGHASTAYGKIEDLVVSLRVVTPAGTLVTRTTPASAAGPDLDQLLIGSEGVYGVITQATLRVHPVPEVQDFRALVFRRFQDGLSAIREMLQKGIVPSTVRLSDPFETQGYMALRRVPASRAKRLWDRLGQVVLKGAGYDLRAACLMILGIEGTAEEVKATRREALRVCRGRGAFHLGESAGRAWYRERFDLPYLRDVLLDHGVMVDTLETATTWDNLPHLYARVHQALVGAIQSTGARPWVMCHLSHAYREGASLYYTFLARQTPSREIEQWRVVKQAATEAIMAGGGSLSHHHGVGQDHARWLGREDSEAGVAALRAVKQVLDPAGIMNPGKLFTH